MRESWTDDRLDDLREDMNRGFANARQETAQLREDMNRGFANAREETAQLREDMNREFTIVRAEMKREFTRVDTDVREIRGELAALNRTMTIGFATIGGGVLASIAATVLTAILG